MERRRDRRIKRRLTCEVFHGMASHRGIILDLGPGGVFIRTNALLSPGTEIDVHLAASVAAPAMTLRGCVVRRRSVPATLTTLIQPGIGVKILDAPREYGLLTSDCELEEAIQSDFDFSAEPDLGARERSDSKSSQSGARSERAGRQPRAESASATRESNGQRAEKEVEKEQRSADDAKVGAAETKATSREAKKRRSRSARAADKRTDKREPRQSKRSEAAQPARPISAVLVGDASLDPIASILRELEVETIRCGPYDPQLTALDDASVLVVSGEIAMSDPIPVDTDRLVGIAVCGDISETMRSQIRQQGFRYLLRSHIHPDALRLLVRYAVYAERDRRGRVRHPVGCEVSWRIGWTRNRGRLLDISRAGCCLLVENAPEIGSKLTIKIPAETLGGKALKLRGRVVRSTPNAVHRGNERTALGLTLDGVTAATSRMVADLCERWSESPPELPQSERPREEARAVVTRSQQQPDPKLMGEDPRAEGGAPRVQVEDLSARPDAQSARGEPIDNRAEMRAARTDPRGEPSAERGPDATAHDAGSSSHATKRAATPRAPEMPEAEPASDERSTRRSVFEREVVQIDEESRVVQALLGRDLSIEGVRVVRQPGLVPGDKLRLALFDTAHKEPLILGAEVCRDDSGSGLLLRFSDLSAQMTARIEEIMETLPAVESIDPHGDAKVVPAGIVAGRA